MSAPFARSDGVPITKIALVAAAIAVTVGCTTATRQRPSTAELPRAVPRPDPAQVAHGRQVYVQQCAVCHGANAEGAPHWQTPDARGDLPAPPHNDSGHTWRHSDAQLRQVVRNGLRDPFNKTPELTMPPFTKDRLSDPDLEAVLVYFKSLWSTEHRIYQEEENHRPPMPAPGRRR